MDTVDSIPVFAGIASRARDIHREADRLFYEGRLFKKIYKWMEYVNEQAKALPEEFLLTEEPATLLQDYANNLEKYRRSQRFGTHVLSALVSMATLKPVDTLTAFAKIGACLHGLEAAKLSTELYALCDALEKQYRIYRAPSDPYGHIRAARVAYNISASAYASYPTHDGGVWLT